MDSTGPSACVDLFCFVATFDSKPSSDSAQSELRVEVTALRAHNLPYVKRWLNMKRRFFVTVTYQTTTKKSVSVKINEQTVEWGENLGTFFVRPSSQLTLRLYAKRFLRRAILIGTHEMRLPAEPTSDQTIDLDEGHNRRAGESARPVTLHLTVAVSVNPTRTPDSPINVIDTIVDAKNTHAPPITDTGARTRSGVGKSTLINSIFRINAAHVEDYKPGKADIQQEFVSAENPFFVLHDSKGFEPGDLINFETVCEFIQQRSRQELPLSERIHGLWLCTETPTAGSRVFEKGDEELLLFAHNRKVPIVVVFTQYDRLVRTKEDELREDYPHMDPTDRHNLSIVSARKEFDICLGVLRNSMKHLGIPMPRIATVSVRPGRQEDVSSLVKVTQDIVKERVKGDAWVMWAIAQRASLPLKIDTCLTKGTSYYRRVLMGSVPGLGQLLLRHCLEKVHKDIVTCWNFKGEVLNSPEFQQQMLGLVQDVHSTEPNFSIFHVAILGSIDVFVQWLSTTYLENVYVAFPILTS
ncbi:hypothetical protein H4582DRAFT_2068411 [Lactarius indigo]|nr:hypothetical protein H4582DRAFT_2068411 [Lactarius indigo]